MIFIRKTKIKSHIERQINKERTRGREEKRKALEEQARDYEDRAEYARAEYEAMIDSLERQVIQLQSEIRGNERRIENAHIGAKTNRRIVEDMRAWAERFMMIGSQSFKEIGEIYQEADSQCRRVLK